jgi:hypothetical protein
MNDGKHWREARKKNAELSAQTDRGNLLKALQRLYSATNDWALAEFAKHKKATAPAEVEGALREARTRLDEAYGVTR